MLQQLASEVGKLRTQTPLRSFKPDSMRVAAIGNCVVNKLSSFLGRQPGVDSLFCSNLRNWGNHHRDSFLQRAHEADVVLALKSERGQLIFSSDEIARMFGAKVVFVPVIWIEGLDTLQQYGDQGSSMFAGGDAIAASISENGAAHTYDALVRGRLRTDPPGRLARSLAELRAVEDGGISISDFIEDRLRDIPQINAIGHPTGEVILELFARLCKRMGIPVDRAKLNAPLLVSQASLPRSPRVFSPYDVDDLGLNYEPDPDWMLQAKSMLAVIQNKLRNGSYVYGGERVDIL